MNKLLLCLLVLCTFAFSQESFTFKTTHRFTFNIEQDTVMIYTGSCAELTTFTLYLDPDTSHQSYFIHQTPKMASKYYIYGKPLVTDQAIVCTAKSDAGNIYQYYFFTNRKEILAKHFQVTSTDPFKGFYDWDIVFVME